MREELISFREGTHMHKIRLVVLAALVVVVIGGSVWAWRYFREDPEVAKARELGNRLRTAGADLSDEDRGKLWSDMRDQMGRLTDEQRRKLWEQSRAGFEEAMERRLDEYFDLPPDQRD